MAGRVLQHINMLAYFADHTYSQPDYNCDTRYCKSGLVCVDVTCASLARSTCAAILAQEIVHYFLHYCRLLYFIIGSVQHKHNNKTQLFLVCWYQTKKKLPVPRHYSAKERYAIAAYSIEHNSNVTAVKHFNVPESTVRKFTKQQLKLRAIQASKSENSG